MRTRISRFDPIPYKLNQLQIGPHSSLFSEPDRCHNHFVIVLGSIFCIHQFNLDFGMNVNVHVNIKNTAKRNTHSRVAYILQSPPPPASPGQGLG